MIIMRVNKFHLGLLAVMFFLAGTWLLASPSFKQQSNITKQDKLLESIEAAMSAKDVAVFNSASSSAITLLEPEVFYMEETHSGIPVQIYEPLNISEIPSGIEGIGILTIESIDLRLPVMNGVDEDELRIAPGRVPQTAQIGEIGNAVIAGHRNYSFGSMFNRLDEVEIGDIVQFQALCGEIMLFEVFEILVILPEDQIAFIQPQDESIITLYTCTPIRVATHRLLIRAAKI